MPSEPGIDYGQGQTTYTLYNSDGSVASQTTTSYPTMDYTGNGDPAAFLQPGETLDTSGADPTGLANNANHNPVMDPKGDIVQAAIDDTKAAADFVATGVKKAADKLPSVLDALIIPLALIVAGLALVYFGPALGRLATLAAKSKKG